MRLLRFIEGFGVYLVHRLEVGDLLLDKLLAIALALDLGCLFDAAELLVPAKCRFLGELVPCEPDHLRNQLGGQAALLVEEEFEVLAVRPGDLEHRRGLVSDLLGAGRLDLEVLPLQWYDRDRDHLQVEVSLFVCDAVFVQLHAHVAELSPPFIAGEYGHALDFISPELALELPAKVVDALDGRVRGELVVAAAEADLALRLPGVGLDRPEFLRAAHGLYGLVEDGL